MYYNDMSKTETIPIYSITIPNGMNYLLFQKSHTTKRKMYLGLIEQDIYPYDKPDLGQCTNIHYDCRKT